MGKIDTTTERSTGHERLWLPSTHSGSFDVGQHVSAQSGRRIWLEDESGRVLADANSGLWHLSLGYAPESVIPRAVEALTTLGGSSLFRRSHRFAAELADVLAELLPMADRFFLANSGSEAADTALRICLAYWRGARKSFASIPGAYHGVSLGPLSLLQLEGYHNGSPRLLKPIVLPSYSLWKADREAAEEQVRKTFASHGTELAGVFVEPLQGSGGMSTMPGGYAVCLSDCLERYGSLLVVDEIASGVFRTGSFLAADAHPRLSPDLVLLGKGLTGGLAPLSVVAVAEDVVGALMSSPATDRLPGFTQAGSPIACAAAAATLKFLLSSEGAEAMERGRIALNAHLVELGRHPLVSSISGAGHMFGVHLQGCSDMADHEARRLISLLTESALAHELLIHPLSIGVVPVVPPLNSTAAEIETIVERLSRVLTDVQFRFH